ncbi:MAG: DUF1192 domain-containing protein [Pseudomonadota bacterium]|nr:DUF1192 domain-containing protein [Pseudomonadota bacterium]
MQHDDLPGGWIGSREDAAHKLGLESLDRYSLNELDERVVLLDAEIARVKAHRQKSAAHRLAADALFRRQTDDNATESSGTAK